MFIKKRHPFGNGNFFIVILFILFIGTIIYRSGILNDDTRGKISFFDNLVSPFTKQEEHDCSDYLQSISSINERLARVLEQYTQDEINFMIAEEKINNMKKDLEEVEVVKHGENLYETVKEQLDVVLRSIEINSDLKKIKVINSERERKMVEEKSESLEYLHYKQDELAQDHNDETRNLLEEYNMDYEERDYGVKYYYRSNEPQPFIE